MTHVANMGRMAPAALLSLLLCSLSCDRLKHNAEPRLAVHARFGDIEWVIVDTHQMGVGGQWVAKLTPESDSRIIKELIHAIESAAPGEPTKAEAVGFVVFKLKGGGIQAFNFSDVTRGRPVEVRYGFWSASLGPVLTRIRDGKIGWNRDNSLPKVKVSRIDVWQYGGYIESFRENSAHFGRLMEPLSAILLAFDPRRCTQEIGWGQDPRQNAAYQGAPQFILDLEKPLDMYRLTLRWAKPGEGNRIEYSTFTSSAIAVHLSRAYINRSKLGVGGYYVAFRSDEDNTKWYAWDLMEAIPALTDMGKPDPGKAFNRLLEVWEEMAHPEGGHP